MGDCSPEIMTAVPRFYQNLYQKINVTFNKATGIKRKLINQTINLGKKKLNKKNFSFTENLMDFICEKLVRKKIRNSKENFYKLMTYMNYKKDKTADTYIFKGEKRKKEKIIRFDKKENPFNKLLSLNIK